jgi:4'-phosphopantetheinyl transferase
VRAIVASAIMKENGGDMETVRLDAPEGILARMAWDPGTSEHDRRRILARELIAEKMGVEQRDIIVTREAPREFGYHTQLVASIDGVEVPFALRTATYGSATVVALTEPGLRIGLDIRDSHPDDDLLFQMRKGSRVFDGDDVPKLLAHWTKAQAVLEADGRGVRVNPIHVRLDGARGWIPDRKTHYRVVDLSSSSYFITLAYADDQEI